MLSNVSPYGILIQPVRVLRPENVPMKGLLQ